MKLSGVKYLVDQGVENVWKNKMMAFATFCVLLISLMLVGASILFYINIDSMIGGISDKNEIAVFVNDDVNEERLNEIEQQLSDIDGVSSVQFESKEDALDRMIESMPDYNKIFESLGGDNPLLDGFRVKVNDIDKAVEITDTIRGMNDIYYVSVSQEFVNVLKELRRIITIIASAVIMVLTVVSMIMISNTTKASIFSRREEIQIMKYVGANDAFIRTPFFVEGMITGFFSGVGAFIITWLSYNSVYTIITEKVGVMTVIGLGSIIPFSSIRIYVIIAYVLSGAFIGALGSVVFTRKHINV